MKMHNSRILDIASHSLLLFLLISCLFGSAIGKCSKTGPCSCQTEDGGKLDLTPISKTDGTPQFVDIYDQQRVDQFSWNPCKPFNEGTAYNVMVVQVRLGVPRRFYYSLGTEDSANFLDGNKGIVLEYSADASMENTLRFHVMSLVGWKCNGLTFWVCLAGNVTCSSVWRVTEVNITTTSYFTLICDESQEGQLTALGERGTQAVYDFELRSKYACIKGGGSISAGTVLCIVFVILVFIYIMGGILFQTFVRKAKGKERIPNYDMWRMFPIYVKTGIVFLIRRGKNVPVYQTI